MMKRLRHRLRAPSWAFVAGVLLVLTAGWVVTNGPLPTSGPDVRSSTEHDPLKDASGRIRGELHDLRSRLDVLTWADSLVPLTIQAGRIGDSMVFGWPEAFVDRAGGTGALTDDALREILDHQELTPLVDPVPTIGVFVESARPAHATLHGTTEGQPWCVAVEGMPPHQLGRTSPRTRWATYGAARPGLLQGCTWFRRYGPPGSGIDAWLQERGLHLVRPEDRHDLLETPLLSTDEFDIRSAITWGDMVFGRLDMYRACRAGRLADCVSEWGPADPVATEDGVEGATWIPGARPREVLSSWGGDLLTRIETEFGSEAMLAFWSSERPVEIAFEEAFGLHPNEWTHRKAEAFIGPVTAGPAPLVGAVIPGSLIWVAGALVGVLYALRRRVA